MVRERYIPDTTIEDWQTVQDEDACYARKMAMCIEYGDDEQSSFPVLLLRLIGPLQASLGSWHRLQKRQDSTTSAIYVHAREMQSLCVETINRAEHAWNLRQAEEDCLVARAELFAGIS